MLSRFREFVNKSPWLGWILAAVLLAVSVVFFMRGQRGTDPYSPGRMQETVTIRFTDTNDEMTMTRGQMDRDLRKSGPKLDPSVGIINPKTGKPTGFLFNKSEWDEMITRINREKEEIRQTGGKISAPASKAVEQK
jgi:hypothetical protein